MSDFTLSDEKLLEDFILNNPDLDRLENLLDIFNVFEVLDIVNSEIRHSNVLAWLFNPESKHGLSESFLRQFLKYFVSRNRDFIKANINLFDFEIFDYSDVEIRREWNNIDLIILLNESSKKVVITIENKIGTSEHSGQLLRYRKIIENEFKGYEKIFILLSPEEVVCSDEQWLVMTYMTVSNLIEELLSSKKDMLSNNVYNFIYQYNIILRRYIVGNSEIEQICRSIYKKHQKALDLIFQYKPDLSLEISEFLQDLIKKDKRFTFIGGGKSVIQFINEPIEKIISNISKFSSISDKILYFEFRNSINRLGLYFQISRGEQKYRQQLYEFFKEKKEIFSLSTKNLSPVYQSVYQKKFLNPADYEEASIDEISKKVTQIWQGFCTEDLPRINDALSEFKIN